ncbi:hypothetical protein L1887_32521 [Cichorium endivia]|nr:hypothetical protein L1887_32521 [Cichorium endivia]
MSLQYRCTASILFSLEPGHPTASRLRFDSLNAFTAASIQRHRSHPYSPRISWVLSPVFLRRLPGDLRAPVRENGKTKRAIEGTFTDFIIRPPLHLPHMQIKRKPENKETYRRYVHRFLI